MPGSGVRGRCEDVLPNPLHQLAHVSDLGVEFPLRGAPPAGASPRRPRGAAPGRGRGWCPVPGWPPPIVSVAVSTRRHANAAWGAGEDSAWAGLEELTLPVLVANGAHDVMIHAYQSYAMSQRMPNAKVVLYSDAGHGFLFQHIEDFGNEVLAFLR
ncbi:alpha/beta fold hydrolase [Streptomyces sp. NPDC060064]|uniref:alpha/beta fold hydrolase n=1 Tax=Streptomyces sp. NPDC060064 TaxID=3347049 RepID=UPI0036B0B27B